MPSCNGARRVPPASEWHGVCSNNDQASFGEASDSPRSGRSRSFDEAGIVIAFPQRDAHLDSLAPLEERLVDTEGKLS
jgi:hypothetical protein